MPKDDKDIKDPQSHYYQLTINNPLDKGWTHKKITGTFVKNFKTVTYFCMADEQGSTFHTHVFVCFNSRVRFSTVKRYFPEAHIIKTTGTVSENVNYIKKEGKYSDTEKAKTKIEGTFKEWGKQPPDSKGRHHDMTQLYQMVSDGMTNAEILAINQDYILNIDKIDKLRTILLTERYKNTRRLDLKVIYISGETGTNKTRNVLDKHGDANVYRVVDYQNPFDSYNCQPVICFDEFRSSLRLKDMLNYCDIYPVELPARYANKYACYNTIYIISNWELERQYAEAQKDDEISWRAFLRRICEIRCHDKDCKVTVYHSVKEYFNRKEEFHQPTEDETADNPFLEAELPEQLDLPL